MHVHAHAGTRVHEATSLTGLVPERVQLTVHTTEPTGTVPERFHCDHIARWSATGTSGRSGTGLNTGNWNGSGTVLVSNLWCEHGHCKILKFADDTKLFRKVKEIGDTIFLQEDDIDTLVKWSEKWQMLFNFGKCKCLHTGSGNTGMNYEMGGTILSKKVKEKDLGVTMNANMKVSEHCTIAAS